jgi:hypothetical protein
MVDVGYCIDGKRGIIDNVMQIGNHATDHLVFAKDGEQYALKKTDIEYVIPHDKTEDCPKFIKSKDVLDVLKLKTNKEKFEEVFGMPPKNNLSICDIVDCRGHNCENCKFKSMPWMMRDAWNDIWRGKES